jgi:hypothetical protein
VKMHPFTVRCDLKIISLPSMNGHSRYTARHGYRDLAPPSAVARTRRWQPL